MDKLKRLLLVAISAVLSANSFAQWNHIPSSPPGYIYDIVESNNVLFLTHFGDGVYKSTDGTMTWELISQGLSTPQAKMVYQLLVENDTLYAATVDGIYKSSDGGDNWVKKSNGIIVGGGALYEFTRSIFKHNGNLFTGAHTSIYRSTDGGENWQITNVSGQHVFPQYFVNHNGTLFAARETNNQPYGYKSTDDGLSWEYLTSISIAVITFLSEPVNLWAGTIHGVWLSTDNGANWEERNSGLPPDPYNSSIIRVNGNLISSVKFGGSGVFRSTNEGISWEDFGGGLPFINSIEKLIPYGDKIIAATSDGLWERDIITGVEFENSNLTQTFTLYQNYPNPFNPSTEIKFFIPKGSHIRLEIYDIPGQRIKILVDDYLARGDYTARWDGKNQSGNLVSSGIYIYKLVSENLSISKKMILMR